MIKIFLVDDHNIVRAGIKQLLQEENNMEVVGEAASAKEFFEVVKLDEVDLIVLDITLPDKNGIEILKEVKSKKPGVMVLMLSIFEEGEYALRSIKAGASGYLCKSSAPEQLISAVNTIAAGKKWIGPALAEVLADEAFGDLRGEAKKKKLSSREFQILCFLSSGMSPKEVAYELDISIKTISTYKSRIFDKLDLKTNTDMIQYAIKHDLIK